MLMMSPQNGIVIQKTKIRQSREQRKYQAKKKKKLTQKPGRRKKTEKTETEGENRTRQIL
jgi:hypothetical protein